MVSVAPWYANGFYNQVLKSVMDIIAYRGIQLTSLPERDRFCYRSITYCVDTSAGNMLSQLFLLYRSEV